MQTHPSDDKAMRVLTQDELNQVSGGVAENRGRTFNPQPDPPGATHNPSAY